MNQAIETFITNCLLHALHCFFDARIVERVVLDDMNFAVVLLSEFLQLLKFVYKKM